MFPGVAQARRHHHFFRERVVASHFYSPRHFRPARLTLGGGSAPPFSMYAVDGNTGRVLYERDGDAVRHPASITKVMTLYLLFEQIEKGRMSLDSRIAVSENAAVQAPTKLGLRPGSTIRVEDAIKAIVTKSANDMAVAVAESIGGDEATFASMMTRKAHALGMSRTNFVNASGLPDDMQLTTAHDLATLGRAIHDHYPRYYRFFSTPSFRYAGQYMANHNHLMEQVEGMDGIKTGYTRSSGFNLLSSVNRNGHWLVSVVLGGRTRLTRDRIMADLIEAQIDNCATRRTAPMIAENPAYEQRVAEAIPVVQHTGEYAPPVEAVDEGQAEAQPETAAPGPVESAEPEGESEPAPEPIVRAAPAVIAERPVARPVRVASLAGDIVQPRPRPAFVSGVPKARDADMSMTGSIKPRQSRYDGSTSRYIGAATATPSTLRHNARRDRAEAKDKPKTIKVARLENTDAAPTGRPTSSRGGWMIQIGAPPSMAQANGLLSRAKSEGHAALAGMRPFTEKVQKGRETLYRARFSGLDTDTADRACKALKRVGMSCFATRN